MTKRLSRAWLPALLVVGFLSVSFIRTSLSMCVGVAVGVEACKRKRQHDNAKVIGQKHPKAAVAPQNHEPPSSASCRKFGAGLLRNIRCGMIRSSMGSRGRCR